MKIREVKIPSNISGYKIKHFHSLVRLDEIVDYQNPSIMEKIMVCSEFSGLSEQELKMMHVKSINKLYSKILKTLDTYHPKPHPPKVLNYEDQEYVFQSDFTKLKAGWFVDVSAVDFKTHPSLMAAFCYIEKGMEYAQTDKHQNILNPLERRKKVFEKHMPLNTYIDLSTFFLRIWVEWRGSSIQAEARKKELREMRKQLKNLNGKMRSMKLQRNSDVIGKQS